MLVKITETGKTNELPEAIGYNSNTELTCRDNNVKYDHENEIYTMDQETYDWWNEYITNHNADEVAIAELVESGANESDIRKAIDDNGGYEELSNEHNATVAALEELRKDMEWIIVDITGDTVAYHNDATSVFYQLAQDQKENRKEAVQFLEAEVLQDEVLAAEKEYDELIEYLEDFARINSPTRSDAEMLCNYLWNVHDIYYKVK